ncbi:MAG TPA: NUDIX hydrolase [Chthoniobacterales bacterium]|nr:NUDIX hydrolase [Chthoniobacterales bacterium]
MKSGTLPLENDGWETLSEESHYAGAHLSVATHEVRTPSRPAGQRWTVAHRKAAVIIAPMTADGRLVLIRQERIPIRSTIWEVPGGQIDDTQEVDSAAREAVALRELREETGYELTHGGELVPLGPFFSSPGFTDEHSYFFLARPVQPGASGHAHEESECILECQAFTPRELREMIASGEICDANTLSMCARLVARGFLSLGE